MVLYRYRLTYSNYLVQFLIRLKFNKSPQDVNMSSRTNYWNMYIWYLNSYAFIYLPWVFLLTSKTSSIGFTKIHICWVYDRVQGTTLKHIYDIKTGGPDTKYPNKQKRVSEWGRTSLGTRPKRGRQGDGPQVMGHRLQLNPDRN